MPTHLCLVLACWLLAATSVLAAPAPIAAREQLNALLWQQQTAEYQAAALLAYRYAGARLAGAKASRSSASVEQQAAGGFAGKRAAVVLDIDETVLDNTPFNALLVREGRAYDALDWAQWVGEARAAAVPGAREFVLAARARAMRVVFITNRECKRSGAFDSQGLSLDCAQKQATLSNLEAVLGYRPLAQDLLMRYERQGRDDSDKQARRLEVAATHRIAMLVGDDLNDFIRRADYVPQSHAARWGATSGTPWVLLPNAIYGSWERAYASLDQKLAALVAWQPADLPAVARLQVVSWNLAWLADPQLLDSAGFWTQCAAQGFPNLKLRDDLPFCDVYKRGNISTAQDYAALKLAPLRARLAELAAQGMDVLAVQEVGGPGALQAVLPAGWRVACFTTRIDAQNVGYAVRESGALVLSCQEVVALSQEGNPAVPRPVRRGLELVLTLAGPATRTLSLLNVHLKSSCPVGRLDSTTNLNCATLQQQAPALEAWIEAQAAAGRPFAIIGDWNRDLDAEVAGAFAARSDGSDPAGPLQPLLLRNLWPEINDQSPPSSAMEIAAVDRRAAAATPTCHDVLDQLAVSLSLKTQLTRASLQEGRVPAALLPRPAAASDHCPLRVELLYR